MNNTFLLKKGNNKNLNLFIIHAGNGEIQPYILFSRFLSTEINCWGIRVDRLKHFAPINRSIQSMAASYIEEIKKIQPKGPYLLAGWCFGGVRAFEMSMILENNGEDVGYLSIFNSSPPTINKEKKDNLINHYSLLPTSVNSNFKQKFTLKTEKKLIYKWLELGGIDIIKKILENKKIKKTDILWDSFVSLVTNMEYEHAIIPIIKKDIPKDRALAIPYYESIEFKDLIYYLNIMRMDANAQAFYIPKNKLKTNLHFFEANGKKVESKDEWNSYLETPLILHKIKGNHFSIFEEPNIENFTKKFNYTINKLHA